MPFISPLARIKTLAYGIPNSKEPTVTITRRGWNLLPTSDKYFHGTTRLPNNLIIVHLDGYLKLVYNTN
jgi:hypothetical protein